MAQLRDTELPNDPTKARGKLLRERWIQIWVAEVMRVSSSGQQTGGPGLPRCHFSGVGIPPVRGSTQETGSEDRHQLGCEVVDVWLGLYRVTHRSKEGTDTGLRRAVHGKNCVSVIFSLLKQNITY